MKRIVHMLPIPVPTDEYFARLNSCLLFQNSVSQFLEKLKAFVDYFRNDTSAKTAVNVAEKMVADISNKERVVDAQSKPLLIEVVYRISAMTIQGEFAQINQLLRTIAFEKYRDLDANDLHSLLFLSQTAVSCGLLDVVLRIRKTVGDTEIFDDVINAVSVLLEKKAQPTELENLFFAAKNWLCQQELQIIGVGFNASWIDDPFFVLNIYINNKDPKFLAQTGEALNRFVIDFKERYNITIEDVSIDVCGVSELIE